MTNLITFDPKRRARSWFSLFDDAFGDFAPTTRGNRRATPALNVVESDTTFTLEFELPGLEEKDIEVRVHGDQLTLHAERNFENEKKDGNYHRVEHQYGALTRSLTLPHEVDPEAVSASYKNGVLTVSVPKAEQTTPKRIPVKGV